MNKKFEAFGVGAMTLTMAYVLIAHPVAAYGTDAGPPVAPPQDDFHQDAYVGRLATGPIVWQSSTASDGETFTMHSVTKRT